MEACGRTEEEHKVREVLKLGPNKKNLAQRPLATALLTVPSTFAVKRGNQWLLQEAPNMLLKAIKKLQIYGLFQTRPSRGPSALPLC